jgi:glycosyltransferase involved in cell wall biosynthesis
MSKMIFIDCTYTYKSNLNTGIQRVVRNVFRYIPEIAQKSGYQIIPLSYTGNTFKRVDAAEVFNVHKKKSIIEKLLFLYHQKQLIIADFLPQPLRRLVLAPKEKFGLTMFLYLPFLVLKILGTFLLPKKKDHSEFEEYSDHSDNIFLALDCSWYFPCWDKLDYFIQKGGFVTTVIYDLIPLNFPEFCDDHLQKSFKLWFEKMLSKSDSILTISNSVSNEVIHYQDQGFNSVKISKDFIKHFSLGSELDLIQETAEPRTALKKIFHDDCYLVVGTIEPRKNHEYILESFDLLWAQRSEAKLIIIGRLGWKNESMIKRIINHKLYGINLFMFNDISDSELAYAYNRCKALIIASKAEGFGLPIVEAFQQNLKVMCSDIPVFREVAGNAAFYFDLNDSASLVKIISELPKKQLNDSMKWLNWQQSTETLVHELLFLKNKHRSTKS